MVCPSCGKETKGIKLNGKIFCTFCGELVKDPTTILEESYTSTSKTGAKTVPTAKIITPNNTEIVASDIYTDDSNPDKVKLTETEKEPRNRTNNDNVKITNQIIKKQGRTRTDFTKFDIIPGELDPISSPEIESPHDDLLENNPIDERSKPNNQKTEPSINFHLMSKTDRDSFHQKQKSKQDIFNKFLKETSRAIVDKSSGNKKAKATKKQSKKSKKIAWIVFASFFIVFALIALVLYVNKFATNETKIINRLEANTSFTYKKPTNIPTGYQISYLSEKYDTYLVYYYTFQSDRKRYISIKVEPTSLKPADIYSELIQKTSASFGRSSVKGLDFWQTSDNKIYVIVDGVLYTFNQSGELYPQIFLEFAQENFL